MTTLITFIQRAIMQGIPLLYGSTGEILTEKSGNLNLGIPGIMYVGGISGVIGAFLYEESMGANDLNPFLAVLIPLLCTIIGSLLTGLIYCFLTVTLRANQNVTGLAITTFGVGFGNFFGSSLVKITGSDIPSVALTRTSAFFTKKLPIASTTGRFDWMAHADKFPGLCTPDESYHGVTYAEKFGNFFIYACITDSQPSCKYVIHSNNRCYFICNTLIIAYFVIVRKSSVKMCYLR